MFWIEGENPEMEKSADAFRTISEAAEELGVPQHVLRFWETRFPQIKPLKRAGGRRYYRPRDIDILRAIKRLLYGEGYTIKGVQRVLKEQGAGALAAAGDRAVCVGEDLPFSSESHAGNLECPPLPPAHLGDSPGETGRAAMLAAKDIARLRAALAELAECEGILESARRG
jgi:DNA-binding transcriptional MerR regulator